MKVACEAHVEAPVDRVWRSLTDVDGVLAVLPGAALVRDDDSVTGSLKCKLGANQVTYRVVVRSDVGGAEPHTAILAVACTQARGSGVLAASITVTARVADSGTTVEVSGEIEASGRGEAADAQTWGKLLETLLKAAVSRPIEVPEPVVAPLEPRADSARTLAMGVGGVLVFVLAWRLSRRTRG